MSGQDADPKRRKFLQSAGIGVLLPGSYGLWAASATAAGASQGGPAASLLPSETRLRETAGLSIAEFGASPTATPAQNQNALVNAFRRYSESRVHQVGPDSYWGIGQLTIPRGSFAFAPVAFGAMSQLGMEIGGAAPYASTLRFDIDRGAGLSLRAYVNVHLHDLLLKNDSRTAGTSVGLDLSGEGGGAMLAVKRVVFEGFGTAIRTQGVGSDPGNGDKTLIEQSLFLGTVGFDQGQNKQAYGWTFLNCSGGCREAEFKLGGAGEILIANYVGDPFGAFIKFPEGSGNPGSGGRPNYFGQRITVMSSKLEYHGQGDRMLIDARESRLLTDRGGSNCDVVLREVSLASGSNWPDPARHVVIQVGDGNGGSDAIRIKQEGGWIEGVVKLGSAQLGSLNRRWSFRDAVRAPDPETVQFLGPGSHFLIEWRANENVPVDQYRGGQAFTGAIDAQKAFLWRHAGKSLINTGIATEVHEGRRGGQFSIGGFPSKLTVTGLAVFIDENRSGTDTRVEWFADPGFRTLLGAESVGADRRGLVPIVMNNPVKWQTLSSGEVHVRITKPGADDAGTEGALVVFYFPYVGT